MNFFCKQTKMFLWYKLLYLVAVTMNILGCDDIKRSFLESEFCNADLVFKAEPNTRNVKELLNAREVIFKLFPRKEHIRISDRAHVNGRALREHIVIIPYVTKYKCNAHFPPFDPKHYLVIANLTYRNGKLLDKLSVPDCRNLIPLKCIEGNLPRASECVEPERTES
uniref:Uncharacterized protein n=1 Tax=Biomphalaria glabrata TaxID=6526 RepID=A0A2C9M6E4_BIOGL